MKGKDFEDLCIQRARKEEDNGNLTMGKYGVRGAFDAATKTWRPIPSYPDFEGVTMDGRQFIFDAKVISGTSLPMKADHSPLRQREHLFKRWDWNVTTFYLVHCLAFTSPAGKKTYPEMTIALPTDPGLEHWEGVGDESRKSFSRDDLLKFGLIVHWTLPDSASRKKLPNFLAAIRKLRGGES